MKATVEKSQLPAIADRKMEKAQHPHTTDTFKYLEKKLEDKGAIRMERHPADGLGGGVHKPPAKSGHGGKYTWEGPIDVSEDPVPAAIDEKDPNYVDEEAEERVLKGQDGDVARFVVGEVEAAKEAGGGGVSRIDVDPQLVIFCRKN